MQRILKYNCKKKNKFYTSFIRIVLYNSSQILLFLQLILFLKLNPFKKTTSLSALLFIEWTYA